MEIIRGKIQSAVKAVVYGPEGIGKSTFASRFPEPLFIDTEGSTKHMDVARMPRPTSWTMLLDQVKYVRQHQDVCRTLVIDTADWAEALCSEHICAKAQKSGIEDFGYGKGYVFLAEEFGKLLNLLEEIVSLGINIVITAHAKMRKFEQPDEMGAYDRWEMKLQKNTYPLVKEWADMVLFANYKTYVVQTEDKKNKAQGGKRVLYTTHHSCWDAKNRFGLPDEVPLDYSAIAHLFESAPQKEPAMQETIRIPEIAPKEKVETVKETKTIKAESVKPAPKDHHDVPAGIPAALADLMRENDVSEDDIQFAVASRGYYPANTPMTSYDPEFIQGVLIAAWDQVYGIIKNNQKVPF